MLTLKDFFLNKKQKLKEMRNDCKRKIKEYLDSLLANPDQFLAEEEEEEMGVRR